MPSTKIINVQKHDSFEDVFNIFKHADAQEVIFIFPKGSKFANNDQYFADLKDAADQRGCGVSVMSADPAIAELATAQGFTVLAGARTAQTAKSATGRWEPISGEDEDNDRDKEDKNDANQLDETDEKDKEEERGDIEVEFNSARPTVAEPADAETDPEVLLAAYRSRRATAHPSGPVKLRVSQRNEAEEAPDITNLWQRLKHNSQSASGRKTGPTKQRRSKSRTVGLIVGAGLLIGFVILYNSLASATVTLHPALQDIDRPLKLSASTTATAINYDLRRIPGQLLTAAGEAQDTFSVTGYKEVVQKASGQITIYNKDPLEQRLVATTRFESEKGLVFRIPATITVPGAKKIGGQVIPGSVQSVVYADRPGPDYNISAGRFTVPGLKGGPKFETVYAVSTAPLSGGFIGPSKVVTEADLAKARERLTQKARDEALKNLREQIVTGMRILDDAAPQLAEPAVNAKAGEAADELTMSIQATARTIAFREADLMELVKRDLETHGNQQYLPGKTTLQLKSDRGLDAQSAGRPATGNVLLFTITLGGQTAIRLDTDKIRNDILGLNGDAIRAYFGQRPDITSTKVILSPFWVKSIPGDPAKVRLNLSFD